MINSSYKIVVERLRAFAEGHFYIKSFEHDTLDTIDLSTRIDYPIMQVIPGTITPSPKQLAYSFDIVFTDIARRKTDLELNTEEVISDMTRIALDLVFEITNGQVLFGRGVTVSEGSTITSFVDGYENTITGVTLSITINVPDQWNACVIPADWATGGTGYPSEGMRVMSIPVLDEGNFMVNAYELDFRGAGVTVTREGNIARVTITGGGGGGGLTCEDLPECEVIVDINSAIDTLQTSLTALTSTVSNLSATVGGIQNDITAIEEDVAALQTLTTNQGSAIETIESDIAAIQTEQTAQNTNISNLISDVAALDSRLDGAETNISNLQSTQSSQGSAITSLTTRVTTAENDINAIEAEQVTQNNNITALQTTQAAQATSITDLTTRVTTAENDINAIEATMTRARLAVIEQDFLSVGTGQYNGLVASALSSGTQVGVTGNANHPGVIALRDSTTINGGFAIGTNSAMILIGGGERCVFVFQDRNTTTRSTAWIRMGLQDSFTSAIPTDGVYVQIQAGVLTGICRNNNTQSVTSTTFPTVQNTWYSVVVELISTSLARFTVFAENGTQLWTADVTTNIPTASGRETGFGVIAYETTTDAAADIVWLDYLRFEINRALVR